jgi:alpha-glucosidase
MHMPWQAAAMRQAITSYYAALPHQATPNFVFGNHDISRLATRYGWANHRAVGMLLLTVGGVATLYYGDELGMTDGFVPPEKVQDLMTQDFSGGEHGRDPARTPMQWSAVANSGFTASDSVPWLPLAANYGTVNVANQAQESESTLKFYQALITLRRSQSALQYGSWAIVADAPENALVYLRQSREQRLLIVINFADAPFSLDLSPLARRAVLRLSSLFTPVTAVSGSRVVVQAHESLLLELD